jgi:hypothetical protein
MELKLAATLAILGFSAILAAIGRRLGQKSSELNCGLAILMLLALWLPQGVRDFGLIAIAAMIGLCGGRALGVAMVGVTAGLAILVPGGTIVVLLGLCAVLAYTSARKERRRLASLVEAASLVPGADQQISAAVIGPCRAPAVRRPDSGEPVAAWWAEIQPAGGAEPVRVASETPVSIATESGTARAALAGVDTGDSDLPTTEIGGREGRELAARLGHAGAGDVDVAVTITWLELDASLFVNGVPVWEADPTGGGYRDSAFIPVFRASENNPLSIKLGTLAEIKERVLYSALMWGGWAIPCAGIAAVQIFLDL